MLLINGFGARIELERDGVWTAAPEYKISNPNPTTASCFIESFEGCISGLVNGIRHHSHPHPSPDDAPCSSFTVFQEESREHGIEPSLDMAVRFNVDGESIQSSGIRKDRLQSSNIVVSGKAYGSSQIFPFVFGKVVSLSQVTSALIDGDAAKTHG